MSIKLTKLLMCLTLFELFIGGNGYLVEIGGLRLRVLLSVACLSWVTINLILNFFRPPTYIWILLALFFGATLAGLLTSLADGIDRAPIFVELRGLLYFPMLLFFAFAIRVREDVELVARIIVSCAILQALIFLSIILLTHIEVFRYETVYELFSQSDEFIFRHDPRNVYFLGFFYKGAFHLGVAALFLLFVPKYRNYSIAGLVVTALAFTETRGLLMAFALSSFAGMMAIRRLGAYSAIILSLSVAIIFLLLTDIASLLTRPESDNIRLSDLKWIIGNFDPKHTLTGYGLGAPIGERNRIEMTYLEIVYKQGLIGLMPWIALYIFNFLLYLNARRNDRELALAFHLSLLYVYLATATNTFLTGSIGMCIVLLSTASLYVLRKQQSLARPSGVINA